MAEAVKTVTTSQVREFIGRDGVQVVDCRPVDAYNGWRLRAEPRGGHIRSARSLPYKWTGYIDWPDIVASKEIKSNDSIIVYGYDSGECEKTASHFSRMGFGDVAIYHDYLSEWCRDDSLPMSALARYWHLVSPVWLKELLQSGKAPEYGNERFVLCHAHYCNRGAYEEGHIPGAIEIDTNTLESTETWNVRSPAELKSTLEQAGITHDTTVILYGRFSYPDMKDPFPGSSAGHLGAIRCAFIMMYAGVKDVRVLNGGLQSWLDAGYDITTRETAKTPMADFGTDIPQAPDIITSTEEAKTIIASPDENLVSVRSWREYIGEVSGYNYIEKKGRIPGSVFGNCGSDAYHMENYRNLDHTTREYQEIEKIWADAGITRDKHNAFYCGTGWRASEAFLNAWLMGWPKISVYDGGWFEWSSDENNPVGVGIPESMRDMAGSI